MSSTEEREEEISRAAEIADIFLTARKDTLIMTSRELITGKSWSSFLFVQRFILMYHICENHIKNLLCCCQTVLKWRFLVHWAAPSESLEINFKVSSALVEIVRRITTRPRYILAKVRMRFQMRKCSLSLFLNLYPPCWNYTPFRVESLHLTLLRKLLKQNVQK